MKKMLSVDGLARQLVTDPAKNQPLGDAKHRASRVGLPTLGYTLPDFNRSWHRRLMQMIVDRLHKGGD